MKRTQLVKKSNGKHWVGNGFPVQSIFSYRDIAPQMSPFLLMDYAEPTYFEATQEQRGVGEHPHRGFETVTLVYEGGVSHRDSSGGGGTIAKDEVQWMTAASGVVHEEFHSKEYSQQGGPFEMLQLWVNLPKKYKMTTPRYQSITKEQIPTIPLDQQAGMLRIIAGEYQNQKGAAKTYSPMNVFDLRLNANSSVNFSSHDGWTTAAFVLAGTPQIAETHAQPADLVILEREGTDFTIKNNTAQPAKILLLMGEPLNEPIVGYGPFVMNTQEEIRQALHDYQSGKMGQLMPS